MKAKRFQMDEQGLILLESGNYHYKHDIAVADKTEPIIVTCRCGQTIHVLTDPDEIEAASQNLSAAQ